MQISFELTDFGIAVVFSTLLLVTYGIYIVLAMSRTNTFRGSCFDSLNAMNADSGNHKLTGKSECSCENMATDWRLPAVPRTLKHPPIMQVQQNSFVEDDIKVLLRSYDVDIFRGFLPASDPLQRLPNDKYKSW